MSDAPPPTTLSLAEARRLAAERRWAELAGALAEVEERRLREEPELAVRLCDALWRVGDPAGTLRVAELALPAIRRGSDRPLLLDLTNIVGIARFELGRMEDAETAWGELLDRATDWRDDGFAARAANNLGVLANVRGERGQALTYYERALAAYRRQGYVRGIAQTHYNLGVAYRELGFPAEAESNLGDATAYAEQCSSEDVVALAESDRGLLRVQTGDAPLGRALAARARDRFARLGDPVRRAEALRVIAAADAAEDRLADALAALDEALAAARAHGNRWLHGEVQRDRGAALRRAGDPGAARAAWSDAAEQFRAVGAAAEADAALRAADEAGAVG